MKTVLLAYEREQDLAAVETVLQSRGHQVVKTRSGLEALDAIRASLPDAVVSDVLLPRMDGFALCRRLREDPAYLHLPFVLHSFRVEGPKYEAFAAEVGALRFLPRGSTLDDLVATIDENSVGSGTMRMPALVPELLDRREQDRRRLADLERQLKESESQQRQLLIAERVARERAEHEARARAEFAATESVRIRELMTRIRDLESAQKQSVEAAAAAKSTDEATRVEQSKADAARVSVLEGRLTDLQRERARVQGLLNDAERVFATQPTSTWVVDMADGRVLAASDGAAALAAVEPSALRGRPLAEVLPGLEFADEAERETRLAWVRPDGSAALFDVRRQALSHSGRAAWLVTAHDVTEHQALRDRATSADVAVRAFAESPEACGTVDDDGRFVSANRRLLELLGTTAESLGTLSLSSLEVDAPDGSTVRVAALRPAEVHRRNARWRLPDGRTLDVDLALAAAEGDPPLRLLTARDVTVQRRGAAREERDHECVSRLLDLAQRSHSSTESELIDRALQVAQDLTGSPIAALVLPAGDATVVELAAVRRGEVLAESQSPLTRWRGTAPTGTALYDCLSSQRAVDRNVPEGTGPLRDGGLPETLHRQLVTPMLDGNRFAGALLVADAAEPYDDDDRRRLAQVADVAARLLRRRRSDSEIVSAMDHMERVMFGAIEALAQLAEAQDACKTGRSRRVGDYAAGIGLGLGLPGHTVRGLRVMGQMVDVGMLQIPRELLWRPGTLSASEFELVKTHADRGFEVLRPIGFPWPVAEVVRQHHERTDGSGYPRGLKGEEILLEARIVAVADAVEAMLSPRPHRGALSLAACIDELQSQAGRRYDARVVKACVKLLRDGQASETVILHQGESPPGQRIA